LKELQRWSFGVGSSTRSKLSCEDSSSNLYAARERLHQRFTKIILEGLRIVGVISGAAALALLVCAADLNMAYHVDTLSAKTVF
jgi:hypothetical protein